jgi:ketosteroid isomerase-like protein
MRRFFVTLFLLLSPALSPAQQATNADNQSPQFRELQQVEDRWSDAVTKRDQYGLELVMAPQFIGISASGDVTTRNQQIAHLFVKNAGPESLEQKVVTVRFVGDIAIVNGTYVLTWKGEKAPVLEKGIFSHVFEHVRSTWVCLNSQRTVVAEQTQNGAGKDKPKAKRSDADLPSVPPVYKEPAAPSSTPQTSQPSH